MYGTKVKASLLAWLAGAATAVCCVGCVVTTSGSPPGPGGPAGTPAPAGTPGPVKGPDGEFVKPHPDCEAYSGVTGECMKWKEGSPFGAAAATTTKPYEPVRAAQSAPELEQAMAAGYTARFPKEKVLKVTILDATWGYVRHPQSGLPTRRFLRGQVAYQAESGRCISRTMVFGQENRGGETYDQAFGAYDPVPGQSYTFQDGFDCSSVR
jgi:hypothetical protein